MYHAQPSDLRWAKESSFKCILFVVPSLTVEKNLSLCFFPFVFPFVFPFTLLFVFPLFFALFSAFEYLFRGWVVWEVFYSECLCFRVRSSHDDTLGGHSHEKGPVPKKWKSMRELR